MIRSYMHIHAIESSSKRTLQISNNINYMLTTIKWDESNEPVSVSLIIHWYQTTPLNLNDAEGNAVKHILYAIKCNCCLLGSNPRLKLFSQCNETNAPPVVTSYLVEHYVPTSK